MHQLNELSDKIEEKSAKPNSEGLMLDGDTKHLKACIGNLWRNQPCPYWGILHNLSTGEPLPKQKPRCLASERFPENVMREGCIYYKSGCTYEHNPQDPCENHNHETNPKTL